MTPPVRTERGASMIEVLVTLVIIAFGLLGMAGLQSRLQVSEMEAYQRAQALVLLNDMASRVATNRSAAASYHETEIGPASNCATAFSGTSIQVVDQREWCNALQGASEVAGGSKLGAVIGGRGCVEALGNGEYMVTVAWQGLVPVSAPPASVTCGQGQYDTAGMTGCTGDLCRRTVTTIVRIAPLV
jgi:type IV pilus assembly protein PilV